MRHSRNSVTPTTTLLTSRAVIRLTPLEEGEDLRGFLQGLVTNDVGGALPCWAALLSAQGKAMFDFLVWGDGADLLIDCAAVQAEDPHGRLVGTRVPRHNHCRCIVRHGAERREQDRQPR